MEKIRKYIADYNNPDNLLHGIVKTGDVEYTIKTVKKKYLEENSDIKPEEKNDYDIVQKVFELQNSNDLLLKELIGIKDKKAREKKQKLISENKKQINILLKSRKRTKQNVLAKPLFFKEAFPDSDEYYYENFNCPMDYLQEILKTEYPRKDRDSNEPKL